MTSDEPTAQFVVAASAPISIRWVLIYKPDWVSIDRTSGATGEGPITVTALTTDLLPQKLSDKIAFKTTTGTFEMPVTLTIKTSIAVQLDPFNLNFDFDENSKQFRITNNGNASTTWQIEPSAVYMDVTPAAGTLSPGQSAALTLTINRSNLETKTYAEKLAVKLGDVHNSDMEVTIKNYKEEKWMLEGVVTDAEYDRIGDNLIILMDNKVYNVQPEMRTMTSVTLSQTGSCLSVSKDGHYAVVGHDLSISLVDLTAMKVDKTYPTSASALDVILAPNNWVYIFPKGSGSTNIRCINLSDGVELLSTGAQIYGDTKARLHPSGDYIYGYRNGSSPIDAEKYDIRSGRANYLYDSPYHGQHEFGGNPWISDDGLKMFTREGKVFNLSTAQPEDMIYEQTLELENRVEIQAVDHIAARNRLCAAYFDFYVNPYQSKVTVFSGDLLNALATIPLPGFLVGQPGLYEVVPSKAGYGFFNSSGTKFFAVVQSYTIPDRPEIYWAVTTINVD